MLIASRPYKIWAIFQKCHRKCLKIINTLRPRQNGRHFPEDIFKCIFLNESIWISIKISLMFVPKGPINNIPALVQIMAWCRLGDKPLSEPMLVCLLTHICVTRPQWVNVDMDKLSKLLALCEGNPQVNIRVPHKSPTVLRFSIQYDDYIENICSTRTYTLTDIYKGPVYIITICDGHRTAEKVALILWLFSETECDKVNVIIINVGWTNAMGRLRHSSWWRHVMETFPALLAFCEGNPPDTEGFHSERTINTELWCFVYASRSTFLSKHSNGRWSATLWRLCDVTVLFCPTVAAAGIFLDN